MQLPEHLLPEELRIRVQGYLRTPTAEIINERIQPWAEMKDTAMIDCVIETDDQEQLKKIEEFLDRSFTFPGYMLTARRFKIWTCDAVEDEEEEETDNYLTLNIDS